MSYILGYVQALAEHHAKEFNRNADDVKRELLEEALKKNAVFV
jgi:hypothetical protein